MRAKSPARKAIDPSLDKIWTVPTLGGDVVEVERVLCWERG